MNKNRALDVFMNERRVGALAVTREGLAAFEYDDKWLSGGFPISPFSLPLQKGVFLPKKYDPFDGLFGVFADSLPDGWGRLLVDRLLRKNKLDPSEVDSLNRLAIVGASGVGALSYRPEGSLGAGKAELSLDQIAAECEKMFETNDTENLDELFQLGGSSGGARPKIFYHMEGADWIVKFPCSIDREDIGRQEYAYSICAKKCGILMPETRLLPSGRCCGYFATKRFDREDGRKIHMISVSALLETSHRVPNLDYNILMKLTMKLTNSYEEIERLYRLMCFNVFAHNRDDHSKNFSFLYDTAQNRWTLSPAYDLTYSSSIGGEHATTVDGNGRNPGMRELLAVAQQIKFDWKKAKAIAEEIQETVHECLSEYGV